MNNIPKIGQPFPGFKNGGEMCDNLKRPHNQDLKEFTKQLFEQISLANADGRKENEAEASQKFFDSIAQVLMGDEICAAVAFSGQDILIATNKGNQDRRSFSSRITATVLEKSLGNGSLRLGITCKLQAETGEKIKKKIPVQYQINHQTGQAFIVDDRELEFRFLKGEFPYLPDDDVTLRLHLKELDHDLYQRFLNCDEKKKIEIQPPIVSYSGALQRRAGKLFDLLSVISRAVFRKEMWEPKNNPNQALYSAFIKSKYKQWKKEYPQRNVDDFIVSIKRESISRFGLDQPGRVTNTAFLENAKEHYQALASYNDMFSFLKRHKEWVSILSDSLTYELARHDKFKDHLSTDSKNTKGLYEMRELYEQLVQDYQHFQGKHHLKTGVTSVTRWLATLKTHPSIKLPDFISRNSDLFYETAARYFVNLAYMEEYIKKDAKENGTLANRLAKESMFEKLNAFIVDGKDEVHAEMRLFSHHLLNHHSPKDYFGIAKLCCALCHYTLKQFAANGFHPPKTRGTHTILFKWPLPDALEKDQYMKPFLGDELFHKYLKIVEKTRRLASPKSGAYYNPRQICAGIIERLDGLNSEKNLKALGINPKLIMTRAANQYPDLPPSEPLNENEEKIQAIIQKYNARSLDHAFRYAASKGNDEDVSFLLKEGKVDVNSQGEGSKKTALHVAIENGNKEIDKNPNAREAFQKVISSLLQAGAKTHIQDKAGKMPTQYDRHKLVDQQLAKI